jgi:hypothetical protein
MSEMKLRTCRIEYVLDDVPEKAIRRLITCDTAKHYAAIRKIIERNGADDLRFDIHDGNSIFFRISTDDSYSDAEEKAQRIQQELSDYLETLEA